MSWKMQLRNLSQVAPLVGAWIEISFANVTIRFLAKVAPLVGAWIEILQNISIVFMSWSLLL